MGILNKIKNILFEDDEEEIEESMPVFTKEEKKEVKRETRTAEPEVTKIEEDPIKVTNGSRFKNIKRDDIDLGFDEKDVLDEVTNVFSESKVQQKSEEVVVSKPKVEEKKSPFLSFDEDEFDRLNSRINKNEEKVRNANTRSVNSTPKINNFHNEANNRKNGNNNFSSTSVNRDKYDRRVNLSSTSISSDKKPFTPSPVISPVYGILDKNYKKTDIVDKKDADFTRSEKLSRVDTKEYGNNLDANLDMVRKKAYGLDEIIEEKELKDDDLFKEITVDTDLSVPESNDVKLEIPELDEEVEIEDNVFEEENENDLTDLILEDVKEVQPQREVKENRPARVAAALEDLEKTSTLQILDDIEKELNAIKPISKTNVVEEVEEDEDEDTLENDLFNLIDSMYEEGENEND